MKKRIIFDVDGMLIPTPNYEEAVEASFQDLGIDYTSDDVTNTVRAMLNYEKSHESYNYDDYLEHIRSYVSNIEKSVLDNYFHHTERLVPHEPDIIVLETLEYLMSRHYDLGILSNYFKSVQEEKLNILGYLRYFHFILGGDEVMKPNAKAYYQVAEGIKQDNVVFIGSSRVLDYEVPKSLGFSAILYDPNYQYPTKTLVRDFSDIRKVL